MPQYELSQEEINSINSEVHDENSEIVKFLVGYTTDNSELFVPYDIKSNDWDSHMQTERDMLNAMCIHFGVSTEKCKDRYILSMRFYKVITTTKTKWCYRREE